MGNCISTRPSTRQDSPSPYIPMDIFSQIISVASQNSANLYVRCRLVSLDWRRLTDYSPSPPLPSPQIPFLLIPRNAGDVGFPLGYVSPLAFSNPYRLANTYPLPQLEQTKGRISVGSSHGWLITLGRDSSMSLLNPVTRDSFHLASLSSIDNTVLSFNPSSYPEYHLPQKRRFSSQASLIRRAVLSSDLVKDPRFTVLLFFSGLTDCCYTCTKDSTTWGQHFHEPFLVEDAIFFGGFFFAVDLNLTIVKFDFQTGLIRLEHNEVFGLPPNQVFLVVAEKSLVLLAKLEPINQQMVLFSRIWVYKVEMSCTVVSAELKFFSDFSLFVSHGCSVCVSKHLFPVPGMLEGRVYFPHVHTRQGNDEAAVYEYCLKSITTTKAFEVENPMKVVDKDTMFSCSRFFWVTPNLIRK